MNCAALLIDAFGRIAATVDDAVDGLTNDALAFRVDPQANSIAWLVWHLTRIQDDHIAAAFGVEQVWIGDGWVERFGMPFDARAHGYGHTTEEVGAVRTSADLLLGYHEAVHLQTVRLVRDVTDDDLDRVVDRRWDPPVTLGVRLVSVVADDLMHAGQAAFVRGLLPTP